MLLYSDVLERLYAVFRNTSNNKKAGTRPVSRLLVPAILKVYLLCGVATNMCLARVVGYYSTLISILVPEHQLAIKGVDEDGFVATNLVG